jgi:hypothetical protein
MYRYFFLFLIYLLITLSCNSSSYAQSCTQGRPYCKNISSCLDAMYYLEICGLRRLDRDGDGIPCEDVCGQKFTPQILDLKQKLKAQGQNKLRLIPQSTSVLKCGLKNSCREMLTCKEARFYFTACSLKHLDGDNDGKPCNRLCK